MQSVHLSGNAITPAVKDKVKSLLKTKEWCVKDIRAKIASILNSAQASNQ